MTARTFEQSAAAYEAWLHDQVGVVEADLARKRERMRKNATGFLRGSYFRWAEAIPAVCPEAARTPAVLSVGDSHVENFGVWRDAEGRLCWGINDFDECATIPHGLDLVRLAASAMLARDGEEMKSEDICAEILDGYRERLDRPSPYVLDEEHVWMREFGVASPARRNKFWNEIDALPDATPPPEYQARLRAVLPPRADLIRFAARVAGIGSLGRPRFVAIARWRGGRVVREAKALAPSAWTTFLGRAAEPKASATLAHHAFRSPDPFLTADAGIIVRRLAPDSRKLDLDAMPDHSLRLRLLHAMGGEIGNVHAATPGAAATIGASLAGLDRGWLLRAARDAVRWLRDEFDDWKGR
jgi:hypothetical protein